MKLFFVALISFLGLNASALECPVEFGNEEYLTKVLDLVRSAPSCHHSAELAMACGMGSSIDIEIAGQARYTCELNFSDKLSESEMATYRGVLNKCYEKYANEEGTIYLSAQAFCELKVAEGFESAYSEVAE